MTYLSSSYCICFGSNLYSNIPYGLFSCDNYIEDDYINGPVINCI